MKVLDRLPRPDAQGGDRRLPRDRHAASTACCSPRRTASSTRAASRPSCAASASRANVHRVPDYTGAGQEEKQRAHPRDHRDRRDARLHARVRRLRLHGRGRRRSCARSRQAGLALHGPVVARGAPRRRQGRGQEARALSIGNVGDARRRRRRRRARCCASTEDTPALEALAKEHGLASRAGDADDDALEENAEALLQAGYAKRVELFTIDELQARRCERLRRDLARAPGPAASASRTSAAAAARASASCDAGAGARPR